MVSPWRGPTLLALLNSLLDVGYDVSLETGGAMPVDDVDVRVSRVVGFENARFQSWQSLRKYCAGLNRHDQIKFVLCDRARLRMGEDANRSSTTVA